MNPTTVTIGLDLGDRRHTVCILNEAGDIVAEETLTNTRAGLEAFSARFTDTKIIMETGTHIRLGGTTQMRFPPFRKATKSARANRPVPISTNYARTRCRRTSRNRLRAGSCGKAWSWARPTTFCRIRDREFTPLAAGDTYKAKAARDAEHRVDLWIDDILGTFIAPAVYLHKLPAHPGAIPG